MDVAGVVSFGSSPAPSIPTGQHSKRECFGVLTPSQVHHLRSDAKRSREKPRTRSSPSATSLIVPSQVLRAYPKAATVASPNKNHSWNITAPKQYQLQNASSYAKNVSNAAASSKRSRWRRGKQQVSAVVNSTVNRHSPTGNLPDIRWRSIPMDHLRHHPNFEPLPLPETITHIDTLEAVREFRRESWQWDALHVGRCTTSQAAAALGFLEPIAGEFLGVPRGWRRGGLGAFHRQSKPALRSLDEMNEVLCQGSAGQNPSLLKENHTSVEYTETGNPYWSKPQRFPFAAKYMVPMTRLEYQWRKNQAKEYTQSRSIHSSIRMMWGNIQEPTALLTALNYFWEQDHDIVLKEIGMCGAGLTMNQSTIHNGMLVGATPDALLVHSDGTVEAVEVKNHCPFSPNYPSNVTSSSRNNRPRHSKIGRFLVRRQEFSHGTIMPQYVPQLMMEMLCVGEECQSAIMVRQSAVNGALIMRIHRNDEWIEEMIYWLNQFHEKYVCHRQRPPRNFFFDSGSCVEEKDRYRKFLDFTKRLESKVEILAHIPNDKVQRAMGDVQDLFLDRL